MKSFTTGLVPTPVDHTTIPWGMEIFWPVDFVFMSIVLSDTLKTRCPVKTSMPSLWNFCSANELIRSSNLQGHETSDFICHVEMLNIKQGESTVGNLQIFLCNSSKNLWSKWYHLGVFSLFHNYPTINIRLSFTSVLSYNIFSKSLSSNEQ